jgi:hypothetical protein
MAESSSDVREMWHRFLGDQNQARQYPKYIGQATGLEVQIPYLEQILSSLLFVNLLALLDEALAFARNDKQLPKPDKEDLYHHIEILKDHLINPKNLHELRKRRKTIAHELRQYSNWKELDEAMNAVEVELKHLGYAGERPHLIYAAESLKV